MIIDVHTHPPADRAQWGEFYDSMKFYGVDYAVTSSLHPDWPRFPTAAQLREANAFAREFADQSRGRVIWLAYINPHNDDWREELDACLAEGARGVKLWISVKGPDGRNIDRSLAVLHAAGERRLPVLIHSCNRTARESPGEADTADVVYLAKNAPNTTIIEGHAGSNWRRGLGLREELDNLYADFCAYFPEKDVVATLLRDTGSDRVLFGSDFFLRDLGGQLAKVAFSNIDPEDREKILWKNAQRIFGFPPVPLRAGGKGSIAVPSRLLPAAACLPDASVDHFCFCGRWPFHSAVHPADELARELETWGIEKAYVASADGLYCDDLLDANARFAEEVRPFGRIAPLATLNPAFPNGPIQARRAAGPFAGGFVSPYLHNYRLDDPEYKEFFAFCAAAGLPLWINCAVGDYRWRHHGIQPRPVKGEELLGFLASAPKNRYVIQGAMKADIEAAMDPGHRRDDTRFEVSRLLDFPGHFASFVEKHGVESLVFGSEYPLRGMFTNRWMADQALRFARRNNAG